MSTSEKLPGSADASGPAPAQPVAPERDLARRSATGFEVFGQSLAATGPSIAVAGTVAVVYLFAGRGNIWS